MKSPDNRIYAFSNHILSQIQSSFEYLIRTWESICDQNFNDIIEFHYPAFADCRKLPLQNIQSVRKDLDCGEAFRLLTFTLPYFQVKRATAGRQAMTQHSRMRIAVLINQFKDTTHGESSSQDSQPSAQGRHSNTPSTSY